MGNSQANPSNRSFNVSLNPTTTLTKSVTFTPQSSLPGTFTPASVTLSGTQTTGSFSFAAASSGIGVFWTTNDGGLADPAAVTFVVPNTVTVSLVDSFGNPATGYTGTVHFASTDPNATLPADYTFTAADAGSHTFPVTLRTAGTQTITASDGGGLRATTSVQVTPGAAYALTFSAIATVAAGTVQTTTATVVDTFGNVVPTYTGTVVFRSSDAAAILPAAYTFKTTDLGVHSFSVTFKTAGTQNLLAADQLVPTLAGGVFGVAVQPAGAASLSVSGYPTPTTAG